LHKALNMPYNEKHQLAIRFEAFNSLNHPNWNNPNSLSLSSSAFGRIKGIARFVPVAACGEVPVLGHDRRLSAFVELNLHSPCRRSVAVRGLESLGYPNLRRFFDTDNNLGVPFQIITVYK
jgi:hypothetical protein